jgi:hypothetical protein
MMSFVVVLVVFGGLSAQPQPGDIFREYHYTAETIVELDPDSKRTDPRLLKRRQVSHRTRSMDIWDLEDAVKAEMVLELWGGHVGTSGHRFRVNEGDWIPIPQLTGTPTDPHCYFRNQLGSVVIPITLESLKLGLNTFEFRCGPQICHSFDWGIYKVYSFTIRLYYNETKPRPDGRLISHRDGDSITDMPVFEVEAVGTEGDDNKLEFTRSDAIRVDFVGLYTDFDWEGNGIYHQWHYQIEQGEIKRNIGSAAAEPFRVTWNTEWIPDQDEPVRIAAFITDTHGITYMTPAVSVKLQREKRSVKMFTAFDVPEKFGVRKGRTMTCKVAVPDEPGQATAARLILSTWAGGHADAIGFNDVKVVDKMGRGDYYGYGSVGFDPGILRRGDNTFFIFSNTSHHAAEVNWPGPVVMLEFRK